MAENLIDGIHSEFEIINPADSPFNYKKIQDRQVELGVLKDAEYEIIENDTPIKPNKV